MENKLKFNEENSITLVTEKEDGVRSIYYVGKPIDELFDKRKLIKNLSNALNYDLIKIDNKLILTKSVKDTEKLQAVKNEIIKVLTLIGSEEPTYKVESGDISMLETASIRPQMSLPISADLPEKDVYVFGKKLCKDAEWQDFINAVNEQEERNNKLEEQYLKQKRLWEMLKYWLSDNWYSKSTDLTVGDVLKKMRDMEV